MPSAIAVYRKPGIGWLRSPWVPLILSALTAMVLAVVNPPMRDLQAALARESANRAGVGATYWFDWFGGVSPGSYSLLVPALTSVIGSLPLLCLSTVLIAGLSRAISRGAIHPTMLTWAVSAAAVLNMFSGRVTFAVGAAIALSALLLFRRGLSAAGAVGLVASGLASPLVPAFAGMIVVPFLIIPRYRNRTVWFATVGAAAGVAVPYVFFGAPGSQPYPWTTLVWSLVIGLGATFAFIEVKGSSETTAISPARWIAPVALASALVLFFISTGVGSNLSRFFYLVLPCVVLYWSLKTPRVLALLLSPALVYALFVALYDQVTVVDTPNSTSLYDPLTDSLDDLVASGQVDNHRVELVDTITHAGSYHVTDSVALARGWENQSDTRYNPLFYGNTPLTSKNYRDWLSDNAVAFIAVAATPIHQQKQEAELIGSGLNYLTSVWSNDDWTIYRVSDPRPIVAPPLKLLEASSSSMTVEVPQDAVGADHVIRIRPNRYLTATPPVSGETACLAPSPDGDWTTARFAAPGIYDLSGQFSVGAALEPMTTTCDSADK